MLVTRPLLEARGDSVALIEGRVAATGEHSALQYRYPTLPTIALSGATLTRPFVDTHTHLLATAPRLTAVDLGGCRCREEARARLADASNHDYQDGVLLAHNWDESGWTDGQPLSPEDLPPGNTFAWRTCGHLAVTPAGKLTEGAAWRAYRRLNLSRERMEVGLSILEERLHASGIAGVHEFTDSLEGKAVLAERFPWLAIDLYLTRERLPVAVKRGWLYDLPDNIRIGGIKVFVDGSLGARTAALHQPYADRPGHRGTPLIDAAAFAGVVREAAAVDLPVAAHAIGDAAIDVALDGWEAVARAEGTVAGQRLEHACLIRPEQLDRCRDLNIAISLQPNFVGNWQGEGGLDQQRLGKARAISMNPIASIARSGIPCAFGSDAMPMDALYGLQCALDHPVRSQRLSLEEALPLYTGGSPGFPGAPARAGLEVGEVADLLAVARHPHGHLYIPWQSRSAPADSG